MMKRGDIGTSTRARERRRFAFIEASNPSDMHIHKQIPWARVLQGPEKIRAAVTGCCQPTPCCTEAIIGV